jgi:hypothetical protein
LAVFFLATFLAAGAFLATFFLATVKSSVKISKWASGRLLRPSETRHHAHLRNVVANLKIISSPFRHFYY